jgi:hypothetical protein
MYIYGIYPSGRSDVIPLAWSKTVLFTHVYVSNEPLANLETRLEFKTFYNTALQVLAETAPILVDVVKGEPSQYVYFTVAINPNYKTDIRATEGYILLNGRYVVEKNALLGAFVEVAHDVVYDSECSMLNGNCSFVANNTYFSPCTICKNKDLAAGRKYCVFYVRGFQCFFRERNDYNITCEGLSEAVVSADDEIDLKFPADGETSNYGMQSEDGWEVQ